MWRHFETLLDFGTIDSAFLIFRSQLWSTSYTIYMFKKSAKPSTMEVTLAGEEQYQGKVVLYKD